MDDIYDIGSFGIGIQDNEGPPLTGTFRFVKVTDSIPGDFDDNVSVNLADLDLLTAASAAGNHALAFDLNDDQRVDAADISYWVKDLRNTWIGDANLDREFNSADLVSVLALGPRLALAPRGSGTGFSPCCTHAG